MSGELEMRIDELRASIRTRCIGRRIVFEELLESTNLTAQDLGNAGEPEGVVVVADAQSGGRGRDGRSWVSPKGVNLYFSILLRPECTVARSSQLSIAAAFSLHRALSPYAPVQVKWPNDIWCGGRKLSGILCSLSCMGSRTDFVVVGIGVNVNLDKFPEGVPGTSLLLECGRRFDRAALLGEILAAFEQEYDAWRSMPDLSPWQARWKEISLLEGRHVEVEQGGRLISGVADGISPEGYLRLVEDGQVHEVTVGDAHIRRI